MWRRENARRWGESAPRERGRARRHGRLAGYWSAVLIADMVVGLEATNLRARVRAFEKHTHLLEGDNGSALAPSIRDVGFGADMVFLIWHTPLIKLVSFFSCLLPSSLSKISSLHDTPANEDPCALAKVWHVVSSPDTIIDGKTGRFVPSGLTNGSIYLTLCSYLLHLPQRQQSKPSLRTRTMALSITSIFDSLYSGLRKTAIDLSGYLSICLSHLPMPIPSIPCHMDTLSSILYPLSFPFLLFAPTHNFHTSQRLGCNRVRLAPWQLGSYVRLCLVG